MNVMCFVELSCRYGGQRSKDMKSNFFENESEK